MIVCPNCNHQNPDGAVQCEACYTPLPAMTTCPSCGAAVQTDASFCGQCGFNLSVAPAAVNAAPAAPPLAESVPGDVPLGGVAADPLVKPDPLVVNPALQGSISPEVNIPPGPFLDPIAAAPVIPPPPPSPDPIPTPIIEPKTQIQQFTARLLHVQTNVTLELPPSLAVIHIGKPNDRIPPDIDVSGFPNSEIVSRIHADIRVEGDAFYVEDVGSSNGTYINNVPLPMGNRHRLRPGDRISLGKGDKVTFLFQQA